MQNALSFPKLAEPCRTMDIYTQVLPTLPPKKFKVNVTWNQNSVTLYVNYDFFKK